MKRLKEVLLFLWTLPQQILGMLVVFFTGAIKERRQYEYAAYSFGYFGVSLGNFIIFGSAPGTETSYRHEYGHHIQSLYLGPLYLIVVGIPSLLGNIWDRIAHRNWTNMQRVTWYYSRFPEKWADQLGGVKRF